MWKFVFLVNNNVLLSPALVNTIEIVSCLQIIYLILKAMVSLTKPNQFYLLRYLSFLFEASKFQNKPSYNTYLSSLCILLMIYTGFMFLQPTAILIIPRLKHLQDNRIIRRFCQIVGITYLFHSRVLFFFIQHFLFRYLDIAQNNGNIKPIFDTKDNLFIVIIVLSLINLFFASIKEILLFQTNQTKDSYATKTNIYHQIILFYKALALLFDYFSYSADNLVMAEITSITHLILSVVLICLLYRRLPFYSFRILKAAIVMTSTMFSLSLLLVLQAFIPDPQVSIATQLMVLVLPSFVIKVILLFYKSLFGRILQGKITTSAHAIHFVLLFKELKKNIQTPKQVDRGFLPSIHSLIGTFNLLGVEKIEIFSKEKKYRKESKRELYSHVVNILEKFSNNYVKTQTLLLFLAQIYLKKLKNAPRAIDFVRRVESQQPFYWVRNAVQAFYLDLTRVYAEQYVESGTQSQLNTYFKFHSIGSSLKNDIQQEIDCHLFFWNSIEKGGFDVKKLIQKAEEIDKLSMKIQRQYEIFSEDFRKSFKLPILMYAVYVNNLRQLPKDGQEVMRKYYLASIDANRNELFDSKTEKIAVIIVSLDRQSAGKILEASGSLKDLFGLSKSDLMKKTFDSLFPPMIGKSYQNMIQYYSRTLNFKLNYTSNTYGKTASGDLFELEAHFQLYPYLNREIAMTVTLRKISEPKVFFITNNDGTILDNSKSIGKSLSVHGLDFNAFRNIQEISWEFEQINTAYNLVCNEERACRVQTEQENRDLTEINGNDNQTENKIIDTTIDFMSQIQKDSKASTSQFEHYVAKASRVPSLSKEAFSYAKSFKYAPGNNLNKLVSNRQLPIEDAKEISSKFTQGYEIVFNPSSSYQTKSNLKVQAHVKVRICSLGGEIYKIIALSRIVGEKMTIVTSSKGTQATEPQIFDDMRCVPQTTEMNLVTQTESFNQLLKFSNFKRRERNNTLNLKKKTNEFESEESGQIKLTDFGKRQHKNEAKTKGDTDDQRSSMMGVQSRDSRISKTLQVISKRKRISPLLKIAIFIVYFVILATFGLVGVNYLLSKNSIEEIRKGVRIVNIATQRVQDALRMWQWTLFLYASETKLQAFPSSYISKFIRLLKADCKVSSTHNNQLKNELSMIEDKELLQESFSKNVKMWTPSNWVGIRYEEMDTFVANDILVNQYTIIANFANKNMILKTDYGIYVLNNTANDFLIRSKLMIATTERLLQSIINKNLTNLYAITASEHLILVILLFAIAILCIVNSRLYNRFFRALGRVQESSLSTQIYRIQKLKVLFDEDFESNMFSQNALSLYETLNSEYKSKVSSTRKTNTKEKEKAFTMKNLNLYLLKFAVLGALFVPFFVFVFDLSLIESTKMFKSFENINNQISILSQASYQGDLSLNVLTSSIAFYNNTNMLLFNQPSWSQVVVNVNQLQGINEKLTSVVLKEEEGNFDPVIESVLKNSICGYLDKSVQSDCELATRGKKIGLLSVNSHYIQVITDSVTQFNKSRTLINGKSSLDTFQIFATSDLITIKDSYTFMIGYLLNLFEGEVADDLTYTRSLFLGVYGMLLVYTVYIQILCFNKFKNIDLNKRKILKIIPFSMIRENKALSFYLVKDFGKEMEGVKNLL